MIHCTGKLYDKITNSLFLCLITFINRVKFGIMKLMWVPVVDFTNTRGNHITQADVEATMAVNKQSEPTLGGDSQPEEGSK